MTEKKKSFLKALFGTESTVEIARKIITILIVVAVSIPGVSSILKKSIQSVVREEIAPISQYIYDDIAKLIDKNVVKIQKDPGDVKIEDIETALNYWPLLRNQNFINKPVLEQKIVLLENWYNVNGMKK